MVEIDYRALSEPELSGVINNSRAEAERRATIVRAQSEVGRLADEYARAVGRKDGDPWEQPTHALDAYRLDSVVTHSGKEWESTVPFNVWEPGVSGWRERTADGGPAEFRQPTGAHDAYNTGDQVLWTDGEVYEAVRDGVTNSPGAYPPDWEQVS